MGGGGTGSGGGEAWQVSRLWRFDGVKEALFRAVFLQALFGAKLGSAMYADFSDRLAVSAMNGQMAIFTQGDAVSCIEPEFGIQCPRLDVVSLKTPAAFAALLTSIVTQLQYVFVPFLVLILACARACLSVSLVSRVLFALLEMRSRSPFFRLGATANPVHDLLSFVGIFPCRDCAHSGAFRFLLRLVSTFRRTELAFGTWRVSKLLAAMFTGGNMGREGALLGAIFAAPFSDLARRGIEHLAASFAVNGLFCLLRFPAKHITTLAGARRLPAIRQAFDIGLVLLTAYWTGFSYQFSHIYLMY